MIRCRWLVPAAALCAVLPARSDAAPWNGRLPASPSPRAQSLSLVLDPGRTGYEGTTRIELDVATTVDRFVLHSEGLELTRASLMRGAEVRSARTRAIADDAVEVIPDSPLEAASWTLEIEFSGRFGEGAVGLYRVETDDATYLFTQFESDDARRAFPCFDEPGLKIPFRVDLTVPDGDLAVGNTPPEREVRGNGTRTVTFAATPPLPTYLVAVAVGPFETVDIPGLGVPGRVVVPRGSTPLAALARDVTPPILASLERWFGRPYPFAKLDLIAVPRFWPGAMENAAAITFRDSILLQDAGHAGPSDRLRLERIVAHELAHQWFGDLVTMRWWDDLWLNETFADWMADVVVESLHPEAALGMQQLARTQAFLEADARASARPIRRDVQGLEDLLQGVGLAYAKGKLVLAMFEAWVGPDVFRGAVLAYLDAHAWGNASADDLWRALDATSGRPVAGTLAGFLEQPGLPLVSVDAVDGGRARLSQTRFRVDGAEMPDLAWKIPLELCFEDDAGVHRMPVRLEGPAAEVDLAAEGAVRWIYPNGGARGYFRWSVPDGLRSATLAAPLDPAERVERLGNVRALMEAGRWHAGDVLDVLARAAADPHPRVVEAAAATLDGLHDTFVDASREDAWAAWVRDAFAPARGRIGLRPRPREDVLSSMARGDLLRALGRHGRDPEVLALAREAAELEMQDPALADDETAGTFLDLAARGGDAAFFDRIVRQYETVKEPRRRARYLDALGAFQEPALQQRALRYALEGPVPAQGVLVIPETVAGSGGDARERAYAWLTGSFESIRKRVPGPQLPAAARLCGGCDPDLAERAREFFARPENETLGMDAALARVADGAAACARLRAREGEGVAERLAAATR